MGCSLKPEGYALAIDFGGTKLAACVVEKATGKIFNYQRRLTPKNSTFTESLDLVKSMGNEILTAWRAEHDEEVSGVGVSFGGPISEDSRLVIKSHHVKGWENFPLPVVFEEYFNIPAVMANDADAAAYGEWFYGAGDKEKSFYYLQVSTGIGAGLVIDEKIFRGKGNAGEPGHLIVDKDAKPFHGKLCACGKPGCLESFSAGWGIAARVMDVFDQLPVESILRKLCESDVNKVTTEIVFEAYRRGDEDARKIILDGIDRLAAVLANTLCVFDPHKVGIGGGLTKSRDIIEPELFEALKRYMPFMFYDELMIDFSHLNGRETLLGAALLT